MYLNLIYFSKSESIMSEADLFLLLEESIKKNKTHNITGMLLYVKGEFLNHKMGRFIQVLEGLEVDVLRVFEEIKIDSRHRNVTVLNEISVPKRNFENWSMGFESTNHVNLNNKEGYFNLDETFMNLGKKQSMNVPLTFLQSFYNVAR